jgi:CxxC-x17-CxxC domain-containing protein
MSDVAPDVNKDVIYFAKTDFRNAERLFGFKRKDRRQHTYIMGKSGGGKTALLHNMVVQDIANGEGVCVVDPHGEFVESLIEKIPESRVKDVVYFNPADLDFNLGFNVLELPDPKYKHLVASGLMAIFTKIWAGVWSARMEYILNNAILALLDTPGSTLLGITRILVDKDFRQRIIANVKDPVVKAFWINEYEAWKDQFRNEAIAPLQNKVGQFLSTNMIRNVVGQEKSSIDIFDIMNSRKIFLVNVSKGRIGEDNSALLGAMLITKIQLSAMERVRIPEDDRADFYLYVDEFQNFATDSFAGILSEARKYRLNLILAHQYVGQLVTDVSTKVRDAVFGNVGTMIIFRIGAADAEFLENEFSPEFTIEDMVNLPNHHIYLKLLVDGVASRPFSAHTLPPFKMAQGCAPPEIVKESSRKIYAKPREVVERAINRWSGMMGDDYDSSEAPPRTPSHSSSPTPPPRRDSAPKSDQGKYPAVCSNCGKQTSVPFKPTPGKPVYCSDCFAKIKAGEAVPAAPPTPAPLRDDHREEDRTRREDRSQLAGMGIEFDAPSSPPPRAERTEPQLRRETPPIPKGGQAARSAPEKKLSLHNLVPRNEPLRPKEQHQKPKSAAQPDIAGLKEALKEALEKGK